MTRSRLRPTAAATYLAYAFAYGLCAAIVMGAFA